MEIPFLCVVIFVYVGIFFSFFLEGVCKEVMSGGNSRKFWGFRGNKFHFLLYDEKNPKNVHLRDEVMLFEGALTSQ